LDSRTRTGVLEASQATAQQSAQRLVDEQLGRGGKVALEAGCGAVSYLRLAAAERLVGIDISPMQLERNTGLDERVLGDLETYRFPPGSFDLIVAWFVLEHLERPVAALDNLLAAARPGAIMVLAVPNLQSVKGLLAKVTPQWVHLAAVRRAYPYWSRDEEDIGPFPTKLRRAISARRLRDYAEQRGLRVLELLAFESEFQRLIRTACRLEGQRWELLRRAVAGVSGRRLTASGSDLLVVFEVPERGTHVRDCSAARAAAAGEA
jgi:SAM-dependent methyltransferase